MTLLHRVLIIESDPIQQRRLAAPFQEDAHFLLGVTSTLADGLISHTHQPADSIIMNERLFAGDAAVWLSQFHAQAPTFILVLAEPDVVDRVLDSGADDCILPPYPARLIHHRVMTGAVQRKIHDLHTLNRDLEIQLSEHQQAQSFSDDERTLLRALLDNMPDEVFIKDTAGYLMMANRTLLKRFGLNLDTNIVEQSIRELDLYPSTTADTLKEFDRRVSKQGETLNNQEVVIRRENSTGQRWMLVTRIPMKDSLGRIIGIVGINRDITALRLADETLNRERTLLRALIDNIPDEIFAKDKEGHFVLSNLAHTARIRALSSQGYADDDDIRYELAGGYQNGDRHPLYEACRQPMTQELKRIVPVQDNSMEWILATHVPLYDEHGNSAGIIGIHRDITQVKRAEQRLNDVIQAAQCLLWQATVYEVFEDERQTTQWDVEILNVEAAMRFLPMELAEGQRYEQAWTQSIIDYEHVRQESDKAILSGQERYTVEFQVRQAGGSLCWLRDEIKVTRLSPTTYSLVGVITNITERKHAESSLRRSNELLEQRVRERTIELSRSNEVLREQRKLAEALRDFALALSETLKLNDVLDRLLMYVNRILPPYETASISLIEDMIYVRVIRSYRMLADKVEIESLGERYLMDSYPVYTQVRHSHQYVVIRDIHENDSDSLKDEEAWVQSYMCVPILLESRVIGFINMNSQYTGTFQKEHAEGLTAFSVQAGVAIQNARLFEATQRHALELQQRVAERTRQLDFERAQLRAILDAMNEGVVYHTLDGKALYVNSSLIQLTGYDEADWLNGENVFLQLQAYEDTFDDFFVSYQTLLIRQGYWKGELRLRRCTHEVFDASISSTLVHSRGQSLPSVVSVVRDISAEKQLEEQKARFIATASHELRTPIANIKTRLYLLKKAPDTLTRHLPILENVTERMRQLVEDLLDVSRFEHGIIKLERIPLQVDDVIQHAIEVQQPEAEKHGLQIVWHLVDSPHWVLADSQRIQQVITNLVSNAINYTPEGGIITVSMTHHQHDEYNYSVIHVCDTGIGIPAHLQPNIFKPFFRINDYNTGVGLGLSITKEIVEMHDGHIEVTSVVGEGTCFDVWLPALPLAEIPV